MQTTIRPDESVGDAVRRVVSEFESRPRPTLPPLADTVEPEALDTICSTSQRGAVSISLSYSRSLVVIENGKLYVFPTAGEGRPSRASPSPRSE